MCRRGHPGSSTVTGGVAALSCAVSTLHKPAGQPWEPGRAAAGVGEGRASRSEQDSFYILLSLALSFFFKKQIFKNYLEGREKKGGV